ncbi:MAG: class II aldolase/adducin family protein [Phycisphaerales bacterium]|nr:class II aldolase/adducin family protein [Phycisphaerales bacterium]
MKRDRSHFADVQQHVAATMRRIYRYGMTTMSGGNVSCRDEAGDLWITPSGLDKARVQPADIVRITADGAIEGDGKPSSEHPFHQRICRDRPDVRAIVHAHPAALVALSICHEIPDTTILAHAHRICGTVRRVPYEPFGSDALAREVARTLADGAVCAILDNHGVVTVGADLREAFARLETLEFTARTFIAAHRLGCVQRLTVEQIDHARLDWEPNADLQPMYEGEHALRREVCRLVRRAHRRHLITSAWGTFSARLGGDAFLITTHDADRATIRPGELACISGMPSDSTVMMHRAIYEKHAQIGAVIRAAPASAAAFSVSNAPFNARCTGESALLLRDVARVSFDAFCERPERIAEIVSLDRPTAIIENAGILVVGTSAQDAFNRLEVLELTAESTIDAAALGDVVTPS